MYMYTSNGVQYYMHYCTIVLVISLIFGNTIVYYSMLIVSAHTHTHTHTYTHLPQSMFQLARDNKDQSLVSGASKHAWCIQF